MGHVPGFRGIGLPRRQGGVVVDGDAVVIGLLDEEDEDVCQLLPVKPHIRACLAFMPKWTFDSRYKILLYLVVISAIWFNNSNR